MNTTKHTCSYCGKYYTRKNAYSRHIILCEINSKSKHVLECEREEEVIPPTNLQLYRIIEELAMKCNKMEAEIGTLKRQVETKTKKINIVEWLGKTSRNTDVVTEWINSFEVTEKDVETLFDKNIFETINKILLNHLENIEEVNKMHLPVFCSSYHVNTLYVYDKLNKDENEFNSEGWKKCSKDDFMLIIKHLHRNIIKAMNAWRVKYDKEIKTNEKVEEKLSNAQCKLMNVDFNADSRFGSKIRNMMYNLLKSEISLIEYEV